MPMCEKCNTSEEIQNYFSKLKKEKSTDEKDNKHWKSYEQAFRFFAKALDLHSRYSNDLIYRSSILRYTLGGVRGSGRASFK